MLHRFKRFFSPWWSLGFSKCPRCKGKLIWDREEYYGGIWINVFKCTECNKEYDD